MPSSSTLFLLAVLSLPLLIVLLFSSFAMYSSHLHRGDQPQAGFNLGDAVLDLTRSPILSPKSSSNLTAVPSSPLQFGALVHAGMASLDMAASAVGAELDMGKLAFPRGQIENWGDSGVVVTSLRTDTSTDVDADEGNPAIGLSQEGAIVCLDSSTASREKTGDQKTLRRLAQNREAARKSRLRKKAYVQQLESSRLKLIQLEQELQRARQQGIFIAGGFLGDHSYSVGGNGESLLYFGYATPDPIREDATEEDRTTYKMWHDDSVIVKCIVLVSMSNELQRQHEGALAFDMEYARWLDEHQRQINELRSALNAHVGDDELRLHVDNVIAHHDEVFRLKTIGTKSDVFHMLSGMWTTPTERCFMWLGGFRSSELLKILASHLEPLTDQQLMGLCNLQQSSQQAEDALSQGMEALQQSLSDTLASASLGPSAGSDNVANYMGQMAIAMGKLGTLESFLRQADLLRQQTLHQMHRILTTRQAARALLAISDYFSRLRALSSLWLARPRD